MLEKKNTSSSKVGKIRIRSSFEIWVWEFSAYHLAISKNVTRLCSKIATESRYWILFAIFNLLFEIPPSDLFKRFKGEAIATVYFTLLPVSDHLLPHLNVSSLPFLLLHNNHSTKDQPEFPPLSSFPIRGAFGVRSESVGSSYPDPTKTRTRGRVPYPDPQKPDRAACWSIRLLLAKQEHNTTQGKFIALSIYLLDTCKM